MFTANRHHAGQQITRLVSVIGYEEIAKHFGVSLSTITNWHNGVVPKNRCAAVRDLYREKLDSDQLVAKLQR